MAALSNSRLLRLPIELRYEIYSHLLVEGPVCYPFPSSPITSISHGAPPRQLLLTCRQISEEVRSYYYGTATFCFLAIGNSRFPRKDISSGSLAAIRQAKKVELMLKWNMASVLLLGTTNTGWDMDGWVQEKAELLLDEGHQLELVVISVRHVSVWRDPRLTKRLEPLKILRGKVRFAVGEITTAGEDESSVRDEAEAYLAQFNS